jgi:hypothetical protein
VRLLKNLIPALKPGARILINDHCLREAGQESPWDETVMRRMDMVMLTLLNAQERTEQEFRALFAAAGEGFVFKVCFGFFFVLLFSASFFHVPLLISPLRLSPRFSLNKRAVVLTWS